MAKATQNFDPPGVKPEGASQKDKQPKTGKRQDPRTGLAVGAAGVWRDSLISRTQRAPALLIKDRQRRPQVETRRTILILPPDFYRAPETAERLGNGIKLLRAEIAADKDERNRLCPRQPGEHHKMVSRRSFADAICQSIWKSNARIIWQSGQVFNLKPDGVDKAFGDGGFRHISKLENHEYAWAIAPEEHVPPNRLLWTCVRELRPNWFAAYERAYQKRHGIKSWVWPKV